MKKLLTFFIVITIIFTMSVSVSADPGAFVQSPSANGAPVLIEENSDANVKVTAYRNRGSELNAAQVNDFENAYKSIVGVEDLTTLVSTLASVAENVNVDTKDLAVSDLFYVSLEDGAEYVDGATYKVSIQAETLTNFVCLLKFVDGEWEIVPNVELKGTKVVDFTAEDLGPYAIVVSTGNAPEYPDVPVDNGVSPWVVVGIVTAVCAVAAGISLIVVIVYKSRHEKNEEKEQ